MKNLLFLVLATVLATAAYSASLTNTDSIMSETGGAVSVPGGVTLPTTAGSGGNALSGTAALTLAAGTNVAAVVTPVTFKFYRVGDMVCAFSQVSIDPTSDATASVFTLTLPVARSANFSGTLGASGHAGILGAAVGSCLATTAAKTVTCNYVSGGTAVELVPVHYCYTTTGN